MTTGFLLEKTRSEPVGKRSSACDPYRELIELELGRDRNAVGIWQDLVDSHGFTGGYQSVKRFVRSLRGTASPEARAIITTEPGEECQVDYGSGPMVRDAVTGKYRRTRLFVLTLGFSRKSVRLLAFGSSARVWAELHEKALRRLGPPFSAWKRPLCGRWLQSPAGRIVFHVFAALAEFERNLIRETTVAGLKAARGLWPDRRPTFKALGRPF